MLSARWTLAAGIIVLTATGCKSRLTPEVETGAPAAAPNAEHSDKKAPKKIAKQVSGLFRLERGKQFREVSFTMELNPQSFALDGGTAKFALLSEAAKYTDLKTGIEKLAHLDLRNSGQDYSCGNESCGSFVHSNDALAKGFDLLVSLQEGVASGNDEARKSRALVTYYDKLLEEYVTAEVLSQSLRWEYESQAP